MIKRNVYQHLLRLLRESLCVSWSAKWKAKCAHHLRAVSIVLPQKASPHARKVYWSGRYWNRIFADKTTGFNFAHPELYDILSASLSSEITIFHVRNLLHVWAFLRGTMTTEICRPTFQNEGDPGHYSIHSRFNLYKMFVIYNSTSNLWVLANDACLTTAVEQSTMRCSEETESPHRYDGV